MGPFRLALLTLLLVPAAFAADLRIAAAANLNQVLPELISSFKKERPDIRASVTYAASGTLVQQITMGAPYELFLSANPKYVDFLEGRKLVLNRQAFARGRLVLYYSKFIKPPPAAVADLTRTDIDCVVIANPLHAPYGSAAVSCLRFYHVLEEVRPKLVYAANVSQAAQMSVRGADAAFIALPFAKSPELLKNGGFVTLPDECHPPLIQEAALLRPVEAARAFLTFLASDRARSILGRYGYDPP